MSKTQQQASVNKLGRIRDAGGKTGSSTKPGSILLHFRDVAKYKSSMAETSGQHVMQISHSRNSHPLFSLGSPREMHNM